MLCAHGRWLGRHHILQSSQNITPSNPNFGSESPPENMEFRRLVESSVFRVHRGIRVINTESFQAMILQILDLTFLTPSRLSQQTMKDGPRLMELIGGVSSYKH